MLYNIYTPLLTYKHAKGEHGTEVVPGLAKDMPEVSADGKTYKLTLRPEHEVLGRHADQGLRLHLRHPAPVQGRLRRLGVLRARSSAPRDYADGKADKISGITTDDNTGDITIAAHRAQRHLRQRAGPDVRRAGSAEHTAGQGRDQQSAAVQRAVHDHQSRSAADADDGTQPELPDRQGRRRQRGRRRATSTRSPSPRTRATPHR